MTMDADVLDRLTELEHRQSRFVLATEGNGGWTNFVEARLLEERQLLTEVIATLQREFEKTAKRLIGEAMAQRIRGTFCATEKYEPGDVVALDGGSFMAKRASPGVCPGEHWQLVARQGKRGADGGRGAPGRDAPRITGWVVDRGAFTVAPKLSDGSTGPVLELRELFSQDEGAAR
jgi:hypothetical protein